MKLTAAALVILGSTASTFSRADTPGTGEIQLSARTQTAAGPVRILSGDARIETATVIIEADKARFNLDTREVHATGTVHIRLKKQ